MQWGPGGGPVRSYPYSYPGLQILYIWATGLRAKKSLGAQNPRRRGGKKRRKGEKIKKEEEESGILVKKTPCTFIYAGFAHLSRFTKFYCDAEKVAIHAF